MFNFPNLLVRATRVGTAALLAAATFAPDSSSAQGVAKPYPGIGRAATPKEIAAWDIDVRPDFKGLPPGSGTVAQGQDIWEAKCASCHGVFGESNEVFSPLVGGTTKDDVKTGRVARLTDPAFPGRTTLMKVSTVSTLWDYINRAMPWNAPKSLKADEVYAVTAFLLNLGEVIPENFVLSDKTIAQAQARMPNRLGMTVDHSLWPGKTMGHTKPDVKGAACMTNCVTEPSVASHLPDFARNAHGNLAEQNRAVGAQLGADTSKPAAVTLGAAASAKTAAAASTAGAAAATASGGAAASSNQAVIALLTKHSCSACHGVNNKIVGPSFREVAAKYGSGSAAVLMKKIKSGGQGVWGAIPMPPQTLPDADAQAVADWIAAGAKP